MNEFVKSYTWMVDAMSIFLRYFIFAGAGYLVFYILFRKKYIELKIQKKFPPPITIRNEVFFSMITLLIFCAESWIIFYLKRNGQTKIYLNIHQHGYLYFVSSIVIMVIVHDAYFYWTHRLMHIPKVFKWIHRRHHLSDNPTPWSAFSFHPVEAIVAAGIIPLIVFVIPSHPVAIFIFLTFMTLVNVMGHLGYETFPLRFRKNKFGQLQNTSTNHNLHHRHSTCNYGLYFTFWDRIMGTLRLD